MVNSFLSYLKNERRLSEHTLLAYQKDLEQFIVYIQSEFSTPEPKMATYREIRAWIASLSNDRLAAASINRKVASLRAFYGFLIKKEIISQSPMLKIKSLKKSHPLPHFVQEEAMNLLLENKDTTDSPRDYLILELLYGTGIRLSELIDLKISDVDLYDGKISVMGKRNKQRIIPLTMLLRKTISEYLRQRTDSTEPFLFLTDKGDKLYPVFVQRLVKKNLGAVSTIKKKSPHVLRHTFATHMLNKGADLNAIKELLGHASLSATQIYTHNTIDKLKAVHKQAHPKAE
jgi:integrase/recombinase XerC